MDIVTLKSFLSLMLVAGLMVGFFLLLDKYKHRVMNRPGAAMSIEGQLALGNRQRLVLVKVRDRSILLAVGGDAVTQISTWDGEANDATL